jgi:hypothetical protein
MLMYADVRMLARERQRSLAKILGGAAVKNPRVLDLVVQIVPAERINMGRGMQWMLRDLAMAVYDKGRVRQRSNTRAGLLALLVPVPKYKYWRCTTRAACASAVTRAQVCMLY